MGKEISRGKFIGISFYAAADAALGGPVTRGACYLLKEIFGLDFSGNAYALTFSSGQHFKIPKYDIVKIKSGLKEDKIVLLHQTPTRKDYSYQLDMKAKDTVKSAAEQIDNWLFSYGSPRVGTELNVTILREFQNIKNNDPEKTGKLYIPCLEQYELIRDYVRGKYTKREFEERMEKFRDEIREEIDRRFEDYRRKPPKLEIEIEDSCKIIQEGERKLEENMSWLVRKMMNTLYVVEDGPWTNYMRNYVEGDLREIEAELKKRNWFGLQKNPRRTRKIIEGKLNELFLDDVLCGAENLTFYMPRDDLFTVVIGYKGSGMECKNPRINPEKAAGEIIDIIGDDGRVLQIDYRNIFGYETNFSRIVTKWKPGDLRVRFNPKKCIYEVSVDRFMGIGGAPAGVPPGGGPPSGGVSNGDGRGGDAF